MKRNIERNTKKIIPNGKSQEHTTQQRAKNTLLQKARNYLEQELEQKLEITGRKTHVIFGEHKGKQVFLYGTKIVGLVEKGILKIFNDDAVLAGLPTTVDSVRLTAISTKDAMYCKKCRIYLEKHPGLRRCTCHAYLVPRTRYFVQESKIHDSDEIAEMAEIQFAISDAIEKPIVWNFKKRQFLNQSGAEPGAEQYPAAFAWPPQRHQSMFAERIVCLKVDGKMVPDDCIAAMILGLVGPIEEEPGNVWTIDVRTNGQSIRPSIQYC